MLDTGVYVVTGQIIINIFQHCFKIVREVCNFLGSVSLQQKFEVMAGPALQRLDGPVLQLSFIQKIRENTSLRHDGMPTQQMEEKRGPCPNFDSSFYMFFLLPLGLPFVNQASQECCLFYLRSSLQPSDLPLFYFCRFSPSLSFSHCHSGLLSLV